MYLRKSIFMLNFVNCIRFFIIVHSFSKDSKVVIERMLKGVEYTAYYALVKGEASLVSLFSDFICTFAMSFRVLFVFYLQH